MRDALRRGECVSSKQLLTIVFTSGLAVNIESLSAVKVLWYKPDTRSMVYKRHHEIDTRPNFMKHLLLS